MQNKQKRTGRSKKFIMCAREFELCARGMPKSGVCEAGDSTTSSDPGNRQTAALGQHAATTYKIRELIGTYLHLDT
jgi:hypothetical protein